MSTLHRLLMHLTRTLPARAIRRDATPYLERYRVGRVLGHTVYLHRFLGGDVDHEQHDHPWDRAWSLVLAGTYSEERLVHLDPDAAAGMALAWRARLPGSLALIRGQDFHRIAVAERNTWTLFVTGRRIKGWGFIRTVSSLEADYRRVVYEQPLDVAGKKGWHKRAPTGAELRAAEGTA